MYSLIVNDDHAVGRRISKNAVLAVAFPLIFCKLVNPASWNYFFTFVPCRYEVMYQNG